VNKLTKRIVESAPLPAHWQVFIWDGELRGFGLRVAATASEQLTDNQCRQRAWQGIGIGNARLDVIP
jgi:hypothetical protein